MRRESQTGGHVYTARSPAKPSCPPPLCLPRSRPPVNDQDHPFVGRSLRPHCLPACFARPLALPTRSLCPPTRFACPLTHYPARLPKISLQCMAQVPRHGKCSFNAVLLGSLDLPLLPLFCVPPGRMLATSFASPEVSTHPLCCLPITMSTTRLPTAICLPAPNHLPVRSGCP